MTWRLVKKAAYLILRLECADCWHVIWAWQSRCGARHTTCMHAGIIKNWRRNKDATGGPPEPWECNWCHTRPTEARP